MHDADEKQLPTGRRVLRAIVKLFRNSISSRVERIQKKTENSICPKDRNYKYFCGCCHKWKFQLNTLLIFIVHPKSLICPLLGLLRLLICLYLLFFSLLADGGHRWADQRTAAACNRFRWWWRLQYGRPQQNEGNALLIAANRHGQRWVVEKELVAGERGQVALRFGGRKCMRIYGLNFYTSAHKAAAKLCANFLPCNAIASWRYVTYTQHRWQRNKRPTMMLSKRSKCTQQHNL